MHAANALNILWVLIVYVIVPVFVARVIARGHWREIAAAYGIWIAILAFFGLTAGGAHGEGFGWAMIMALFTTVFAVPLLVVLLKAGARIRRRPGHSAS